MVDKVLLTFAVAEFLFLLNGGLIITFALIAQNQISSAPNVTNVAMNLLLTQTPLSGLCATRYAMCNTNWWNSPYWKCRHHLHHLPPFRPSITYTVIKGVATSPWIYDYCLHALYSG